MGKGGSRTPVPIKAHADRAGCFDILNDHLCNHLHPHTANNTMNTFLVDFAFCPCGEMTAIQPTKLAIPDTSPQPYESVEGSIVVACVRCKRVYRFDTGYLQSRSTASGVGPYNPQAPMRVFQVPIACGWEGCSAQLVVHVMLNSNTTVAEIEKEKAAWIFSELRCPEGHPFPWPLYRD